LPAVVCVHAWLYGDRSAEAGCQQSLRARVSRVVQLGLIYVPVAIAYLLVRIHVLHGFSHSSARISAREFVLTLPSVLFFYLKQWLLPIRFAEFYPLSVAQTFDFANVLVPLLGLLVIAAALWFFRRTLGRRELVFSVAWMFLTLLPTLDFAVFPPGDIVHDRYFYLPSFGAALLVALAVDKLAYGPALFALPRGLVLLTLCVLPPLSYASATASSYWIDDYIMFDHARSIAPDNPTVRNNLAVEVASRGNLEAARPMLSDLLRDSPNNYQANYNFARLSYQVGDLAVAEQYFERAQKINPSVPEPYLQLGLIELRNKKLDAAEMEIRRAIAIRPMEPAFQFALGITLAQRGNCDAARAAFSEALVLNPGFPNAHEQMEKCHP
jgi:tetratricopeptide (TPR) repeat protein